MITLTVNFGPTGEYKSTFRRKVGSEFLLERNINLPNSVWEPVVRDITNTEILDHIWAILKAYERIAND